MLNKYFNYLKKRMANSNFFRELVLYVSYVSLGAIVGLGWWLVVGFAIGIFISITLDFATHYVDD